MVGLRGTGNRDPLLQERLDGQDACGVGCWLGSQTPGNSATNHWKRARKGKINRRGPTHWAPTHWAPKASGRTPVVVASGSPPGSPRRCAQHWLPYPTIQPTCIAHQKSVLPISNAGLQPCLRPGHWILLVTAGGHTNAVAAAVGLPSPHSDAPPLHSDAVNVSLGFSRGPQHTSPCTRLHCQNSSAIVCGAQSSATRKLHSLVFVVVWEGPQRRTETARRVWGRAWGRCPWAVGGRAGPARALQHSSGKVESDQGQREGQTALNVKVGSEAYISNHY